MPVVGMELEVGYIVKASEGVRRDKRRTRFFGCPLGRIRARGKIGTFNGIQRGKGGGGGLGA